MKKVTKKEFVSGAIWKIIENYSAKGISMLVSIILARILLPDDYGLISLTGVFLNLSDILIDGGLGTALIRKKEIDDYDYSSVFIFNLGVSIFLYVLIFSLSPLISDYYQEAALTPVLRIMAITFFFQAFSSTRSAIVTRGMQFRLLFVCNMIGSITSGVLGIAAAYLGFGVWALVIQRLFQQFLVTLILFLKVRWKITFRMDLRRLKEMFSFGGGVFGSSLLSYVGSSLYSLVIGKQYSVTDLGYYDKGGQLPMQLSLYTFGAMTNVLLPTLASYQTDLEQFKRIVRRVVRMTGYLIFPMMAGMSLITRELIIFLFTEKWLPAVRIMQFMSIYYLATPFMLINVQIFFALGKSSLRVKSEIVRIILMVLGIGVFGIALKCSVEVLALVSSLIAVVMTFVTFFDVYKMIHYTFKNVVEDLWRIVFATFIMSLVILMMAPLTNVIDSNIVNMVLKIVLGVIIYLLVSIVLKIDSLNDLRSLIGSLRGND